MVFGMYAWEAKSPNWAADNGDSDVVWESPLSHALNTNERIFLFRFNGILSTMLSESIGPLAAII